MLANRLKRLRLNTEEYRGESWFLGRRSHQDVKEILSRSVAKHKGKPVFAIFRSDDGRGELFLRVAFRRGNATTQRWQEIPVEPKSGAYRLENSSMLYQNLGEVKNFIQANMGLIPI